MFKIKIAFIIDLQKNLKFEHIKLKYGLPEIVIK